MTNHSKRQVLQAGGSLFGWVLAELFDKKDSVPFTILGGLAGFWAAAELIPQEERPVLSGAPRKRRRTKK